MERPQRFYSHRPLRFGSEFPVENKVPPAESVTLGIDGPFLVGPASDGEGAGGGLRLIRRIELRNYMSHQHTVIDLAEGLTVLVGPNNCGKSAIVSALQTLCENATGDFMVRHGERECSVRVETDDGHVLEWQRKRDEVSYCLDGREVSRLGGSVPDDLHDLLRLPLVESGNTSFDVHFGEQKQPIFLLDKSSGHRATFFASSSDAVKLIEMQRLHRQDVQEARVRERLLAAEKINLDRRLEKLAPLGDLGDRLDWLEEEHHAITEQAGRVSSLRQALEGLQMATRVFDHCTAQVVALSELWSPPELLLAEALKSLVGQMGVAQHRIDRTSAVRKAMDPLREPPPLTEDARRLDTLRSLLRQLLGAEGALDRWSARAGSLAPLQDPPGLEPSERLGTLLAELTAAGGELDHRQAVNQIMESVDDPPELDDTAGLRALLDGLLAAGREVEQARLLSGSLTSLCLPPELDDPSRLKHLLDRFQSAALIVRQQQAGLVALGDLSNPPADIDSTALVRLIRELDEVGSEVEDWRGRVERSETALTDAEHNLRHLADEMGTCPTCGQIFDADLLVDAQTTEG